MARKNNVNQMLADTLAGAGIATVADVAKVGSTFAGEIKAVRIAAAPTMAGARWVGVQPEDGSDKVVKMSTRALGDAYGCSHGTADRVSMLGAVIVAHAPTADEIATLYTLIVSTLKAEDGRLTSDQAMVIAESASKPVAHAQRLIAANRKAYALENTPDTPDADDDADVIEPDTSVPDDMEAPDMLPVGIVRMLESCEATLALSVGTLSDADFLAVRNVLARMASKVGYTLADPETGEILAVA
jgi:hypothetical protein